MLRLAIIHAYIRSLVHCAVLQNLTNDQSVSAECNWRVTRLCSAQRSKLFDHAAPRPAALSVAAPMKGRVVSNSIQKRSSGAKLITEIDS